MAMLRNLALAVLAVAILCNPVQGQEAKKKQRKKRRGGAFGQVMQKAKEAGLGEDEMAALKQCIEKHQPEAKKIQEKITALIGGQEGRKKMAAARKEANKAGKKGKEMEAAIVAALGLEGDDAAAFTSANKEMQQLNAAMRKELAESLSEESLKAIGMKPRGGRNKKKKKDKA